MKAEAWLYAYPANPVLIRLEWNHYPKTNERRVPYMSGYADNAIVHQGVLDADADFIQKPFAPDALARKVRKVLDKV